MRIQTLWIEIDLDSMIKIMLGSNNEKWNLRNLIQDITEYKNQIIANVTYIYRESNGSSDFLAN